MKALTIKQPWAWLCMRGKKDIVNKEFSTSYRGLVAIYSSNSVNFNEFSKAKHVIASISSIAIPKISELSCGYILGTVELIDCVQASNGSKWFKGPYGLVLKNPKILYQPIKIEIEGKLGLWEVPEAVLPFLVDDYELQLRDLEKFEQQNNSQMRLF